MNSVLKRWLNTGSNPAYMDAALLFLRILVAALMLRHGWPKLTRLLEGGEVRFGDPIGLGPALSLVLATFAEFLCSILIILGLGTRFASIPLIITMAVAAFVAHGPDPFGRKELPVLFLVVFIFLLITGSGKYSLDRLITPKRR